MGVDVGLGNAPQEQNRATIKPKQCPEGGVHSGEELIYSHFFFSFFFCCCCENECGNFSAIILSDVN